MVITRAACTGACHSWKRELASCGGNRNPEEMRRLWPSHARQSACCGTLFGCWCQSKKAAHICLIMEMKSQCRWSDIWNNVYSKMYIICHIIILHIVLVLTQKQFYWKIDSDAKSLYGGWVVLEENRNVSLLHLQGVWIECKRKKSFTFSERIK